MTPHIPLILGLHAIAIALIGVPFLIGGALSDKLAEYQARPVVARSRATHHWYEPIVHPMRAAHTFRMAHRRHA